MKPFTALLCLALLSLSSALAPKTLINESCNATELQAGLLLDEINKDRDDGFVFSLFRVVDVHRQPEGAGNIFYFTVNVLESVCPVISGKSWKECGARPFHETVFGQCKAVIYLNMPWRRVRLFSYNCTLSGVPSALSDKMCNRCAQLEHDLTRFVEKAEGMVAKYNSDSNNTHYFKLDKMERASMQFLPNGRGYFTEFSIKETNCARLTTNVSECEFLEGDQAHTGFCNGSLFNLRFESSDEVTCEISDPKHTGFCNGSLFTVRFETRNEVTCEIYDPKQTGHPHHRHQGHGHDHEHGHRHGPRKGHKHHHHHHHHENHHPNGHNHTHTEDGKHHHRKHGHKHGHGPANGEPNKHDGSSSEEHTGYKPGRHPTAEPISSIQYVSLLFWSDDLPIPSIPDPLPPAVPSGAPSVSGPVDPFQDPEPQPFPHARSNSTDCPGEQKQQIPLISSFLRI